MLAESESINIIYKVNQGVEKSFQSSQQTADRTKLLKVVSSGLIIQGDSSLEDKLRSLKDPSTKVKKLKDLKKLGTVSQYTIMPRLGQNLEEYLIS